MKYASIILFLGIFVFHLQAQEIRFVTMPAATRVGVQDVFEVQYSIQNASAIESFSLPNLNDFQIVGGPNKSTNVNISNGQRSYGVDLVYYMKAKRKGRCVLPGGVAVVNNGRQIRSNSVVIEVIEGKIARPSTSARSNDPFDDDPFGDDPFGDNVFREMERQQREIQEQIRRMQQQMNQALGVEPDRRINPSNQIDPSHVNENIFIKVDVDKTKVTLGEQVTASYKLYTRLPIHMNITKLPALVGFWSQDFDLPDPPQARGEVMNGKVYTVYELKRTALFPTQIGRLELDPAEAKSIELLNDNQPLTVRSNPVSIEVVELPNAFKPLNFNGAVGQYSLESNIDKTEVTTDDAVTITLRISGTGNLKLIDIPKLNLPKNVDEFDTKVFDTITNTNNIIAGYKTFTYTFNPKEAGTLTIPAAEFVYYDSKEHVYKKLLGQSYILHVTPGTNKESATASKLPRDIHDIDANPGSLSKHSSVVLFTHPLYWTGFGLPLLAYIFFLAYRKREDNLQGNVVLLKNKKANKIALQRLVTAEKYLKQTAQGPFYEETSKAVWLYLSDKLNIPLSNLSKERAAVKLTEHQIPSEIQVELFRITDECEMALYARDSGSLRMHQTYNDAFKLIGKLEERLS